MLYLIIATLSWSLVGVLVKTAAFQFDSYTITFARFFIGVLALAALAVASRKTLRPKTVNRWIWIGAGGKSVNYLFENVGVSIGFAYGNILVQPTQTIVLLLIGVLLFKERLTWKSTVSAAIVLTGVVLISWNGRPLVDLFGEQGWISILFIISGIGAGLHLLAQKMLLEAMDDISMNYSMFLWASLITAMPLSFGAQWSPAFVPGAWAAIFALGLITAFSFILSSKAMRTVPFSVAVIVSNLAVLFTILWSAIFYREPITGLIVTGAVVVVIGMTMLNWPSRKETSKAQAAVR